MRSLKRFQLAFLEFQLGGSFPALVLTCLARVKIIGLRSLPPSCSLTSLWQSSGCYLWLWHTRYCHKVTITFSMLCCICVQLLSLSSMSCKDHIYSWYALFLCSTPLTLMIIDSCNALSCSPGLSRHLCRMHSELWVEVTITVTLLLLIQR